MNGPGSRQRGLAIMLLLMLLGIAMSSLLFSSVSPYASSIAEDKVTAAALAQAREALIARAVNDDNRPGSLPCPDTDNDGDGEIMPGNECPSYVGRLPWKSLGLPDLRDGKGERLWYALSRTLRDSVAAQPINSDTPGQLTLTTTVLQGGGIETPVNTVVNIAAIIFAPGAALDFQSRDVASLNNVASYLEGGNEDGDTQYFVRNLNNNVNDRPLALTMGDLMPTVEIRVAAELRLKLSAYFAAYNYFPFAARHDDPGGFCALNVLRGRVPARIRPPTAMAGTECDSLGEWPDGGLPSWFVANQWHFVMYYGVAPAFAQGGTRDCSSQPCLGIGATSSARALFFTPGTPRTGVARPSNTLADYLEDAANNDGWDTLADNIYVAPTATAIDRDRVTTF